MEKRKTVRQRIAEDNTLVDNFTHSWNQGKTLVELGELYNLTLKQVKNFCEILGLKRQCAIANNVTMLYPKEYKFYEKRFTESGLHKKDFKLKKNERSETASLADLL